MVLAKSWNMIGVPNLITNTNGSYACIDQTNNKHLVHDNDIPLGIFLKMSINHRRLLCIDLLIF